MFIGKLIILVYKISFKENLCASIISNHATSTDMAPPEMMEEVGQRRTTTSD